MKIPVGCIPLTLNKDGHIRTVAPVLWTGTNVHVFCTGAGKTFNTKTKEELEEKLGLKFPCLHSDLPVSLQEEFDRLKVGLELVHSTHFPERFDVRDYREWIQRGVKFIFPVRVEFDTAVTFFSSLLELPEDLAKALRDKQAHFLIECPWESRNVSRWLLGHLDEFCTKNNLPKESVTLSVSQAGEVRDLDRKFNIRHTQYFREFNWNLGKVPITRNEVQKEAHRIFHSYLENTGNFKKTFLAEIGRSTIERLFLFGLLTVDYPEQSYVSFRNHYDEDIASIQNDLEKLRKCLPKPLTWYRKIDNFLSSHDYTTKVELDLEKGQNWFSLESDRKFRESSFIELVPETNFYFTENSFITEKTYKPILTAKPFIILSGYKFLEKFREDGFKTFGDFWDESYDLIEDPHVRLVAIRNLIDSLKNLTVEEMQDMYQRMKPILEWNFNLLLSKEPTRKSMNWLESLVQKKRTLI